MDRNRRRRTQPFQSSHGEVHHYLSTWEDKVASICQFTPDKLLISLFSQGVFVFNPSTGEKQPFTIIDDETTTRLCNRGKAVNLYQNSPGQRAAARRPRLPIRPEQRTFRIATEQEGQDIIGALLPSPITKTIPISTIRNVSTNWTNGTTA